jgi:RNA polymerase-binding transcription factor DksA
MQPRADAKYGQCRANGALIAKARRNAQKMAEIQATARDNLRESF